MGRDERGSAFSALLLSVNGKATGTAGEKAADAASTQDETDQSADAGLALESAQQQLGTEMAAGSGADAATRLLLGALQASVAPRESLDMRDREPGSKRGDAMAALGSALTAAERNAARMGLNQGTGMEGLSSDMLPGIAMPSEDAPIGTTPDADALATLSALVDDKQGSSKTEDPEAKAAKPISVTVIKQETYLPPVMRLSPFQQVVEPIRQAAAELATARTEDVPELDASKPTEIAAPTKILHLELRPVELGSLLVKMRLTQGGMEIRIEASNAETARMLANDKDALREVVKASGFSVDAVSVETVHIDGLAPDRQASGQGGSPNEPSDQRQGRGFDQSRQGEHQREPRRGGWTPDATSKDDAHDLDPAGRSGRDPHRYL
ncbi:hypothetical protein AXW83_22165 [Bosea sp. PAMC 26642]|nr:hypothetical protein AXW83_22165 [Bosea sp. PAMC 26642]